MARAKRWIFKPAVDGVAEVDLFSWDYFTDFVYDILLDYKQYVYRGHRVSTWKLESTFDRELRFYSARLKEQKLREHLEAFKYATRGRRGGHPPKIESENDWWALGQHFGLATPLLDWTGSPFVAAFFAFEKKKSDDTPRRVIYALHLTAVENKTIELRKEATPLSLAQVVDFFRPLSDENARLVNQGGLFSRAPLGTDLETWMRQRFAGIAKPLLIKIAIPSSGRTKCLKELNRMNVNSLTLFPDVFGASLHCNNSLRIVGY